MIDAFPDLSTLLKFSISAAVLIVIPGPALLYLVSTSLIYGKVEAVKALFGIETGTLAHITLCATGIGAVAITYPSVLSIIQYIGIAYFAFTGFQILFARVPSVEEKEFKLKGSRSFEGGLILNLFNPKGLLFFTAFLPQFIDHQSGAYILQSFILGFVFIVIAIVIASTMILFSEQMRNRLVINPTRILRIKGLVFILISLITFILS